MSTAITALRVYQLEQAKTDYTLTDADTIGDLIAAINASNTFACPECRTTGIVDSGANVCPTCSGEGYTSVQKKIDLNNSTLVYINA